MITLSSLKIYVRRKDVIDLTMKTEREEFEGCGLELPDLVSEVFILLNNFIIKF